MKPLASALVALTAATKRLDNIIEGKVHLRQMTRNEHEAGAALALECALYLSHFKHAVTWREKRVEVDEQAALEEIELICEDAAFRHQRPKRDFDALLCDDEAEEMV